MCQRQWKRERTEEEEEEEDDDDRYTMAFSLCVRDTVVRAEFKRVTFSYFYLSNVSVSQKSRRGLISM